MKISFQLLQSIVSSISTLKKVKFQKQLVDKDIFIMVFQKFMWNIPSKRAPNSIFSFFRHVTCLSFQVPKSVGRAYFAKELPLTEYVLNLPCGIMLSLSAPSFKGPQFSSKWSFQIRKKIFGISNLFSLYSNLNIE